MERQNIIVPFDYRQILSALSHEEVGRLVMAWLDYAKDGTTPELTGNERLFWEMIKLKDDTDANAYKAKCEKNSANVKNRWAKRDTNVYERIRTNTNGYESIRNIPITNTNTITNTNINTNIESNINNNIDSNMDIEKEILKKKKTAEKHKYGAYNNVLLSDEDLQKLKTEFPKDWAERIERLSEYMASKGATYKNHLATIRNWARREGKKLDDATAKNIHGYDQQLVDGWRNQPGFY